jgi:hypothetical protein
MRRSSGKSATAVRTIRRSATERRLGQRLSAAARHPPAAAAARVPDGLPSAGRPRKVPVSVVLMLHAKRSGGVVRMTRRCRADRPAGPTTDPRAARRRKQVITGSLTSA